VGIVSALVALALALAVGSGPGISVSPQSEGLSFGDRGAAVADLNTSFVSYRSGTSTRHREPIWLQDPTRRLCLSKTPRPRYDGNLYPIHAGAPG
jgi:hypothetical protein